MCGIAGFMIAPGDQGKIDTELMTLVLGYEMQSRGKDATGILTVDRKGRTKLRKKPTKAELFLAGREGIGKSATTCLIHARAATQGDKSNPLNNHPIRYGKIIGIHNGVLSNDAALFRHYQWERHGQVDSEAIFAALNNLPQEQALTSIDGSWAIAWINTDDPRKLWLARGESNPINYALTTNGSICFASTASAVRDAMEYGGVKGKAEVVTVKDGFLAHTDPDNGGLIVLPTFDGSGKDAPGARSWKGNQASCNGYSYGDGGWEDYTGGRYGVHRPGSNVTPIRSQSPKDPLPYERVTITGDPKNPKVGDRRKYLNNAKNWVFEICSASSPQCWAQLSEEKARRLGEADYPKAPAPSQTVSVVTEIVDGQQVRTETLASGQKLITTKPVETATGSTATVGSGSRDDGVAQVVVPPFGDAAGSAANSVWDGRPANSDVKLAREGDLIGLDKELFGDNSRGAIIGIVDSIDDKTDEMLVNWRNGRLSLYADYSVLIPAEGMVRTNG